MTVKIYLKINVLIVIYFITNFIGEIGDWKNYFSADMIQVMDLWMDEHFKDISLKYSVQ